MRPLKRAPGGVTSKTAPIVDGGEVIKVSQGGVGGLSELHGPLAKKKRGRLEKKSSIKRGNQLKNTRKKNKRPKKMHRNPSP